MHAFALTRFIIFATLLVFSLIILGLAAGIIASEKASAYVFVVPTDACLGLAVAALTLVSTIPVIVIDALRKGAKVTWVVFELVWSGILWVLWLAAAAYVSSYLGLLPDCSLFAGSTASLCHQYNGMMAFLWLGWILLTVHLILILVLAILAKSRGHETVWLAPTLNLTFSPTSVKKAEGTYPNMAYTVPNSGQPPHQLAFSPQPYPNQQGYQ
ncbi:hypothetical protein CPB86DRAFT_779254, partial [Serendipita vermifera]